MKKDFRILAYGLLCLVFMTETYNTHAQCVNLDTNGFAIPDSIVKQQVAFIDPGASGKNIEWDFTKLNTLTDKYTAACTGEKDSICATEHRTHYYYKQTNKGVWRTGHENANSFINYSKPMLEMAFPLQYGDKRVEAFDGIGEYGYALELHVAGTVTVSADAKGSIMLPDITCEAIRVKTVTNYTSAGREGVKQTETRCRWYAEGSRYPIFETLKVTFQAEEGKDSTIMSTAFIYLSSQSEQKMHDLEIPIEHSKGNGFDKLCNTANTKITELSISPNPVSSIATLLCETDNTTIIYIRIYATNGALVYTNSYLADAGTNTWEVPVSQLSSGKYIIYADTAVGSSSMSAVMIKKCF